MRQKRLGRPPIEPHLPTLDERIVWGAALCRQRGRWACLHCNEDLGPETGNYKLAALTTSVPMGEIAPGLHSRTADQMEFRSLFCTGCGTRLDTEISRKGDEILTDVEIGAA
jgi:acetone carboxylase gamma subunit